MKAAIIGAGVSGLSLAWFLQKEGVDFTVFEASRRVGGKIESDCSSGFFFEKGPRSFSVSRSDNLLDLIEDLGLSKDIIGSADSAKKRYLLLNGKLVGLPSSLSSFFTNPISRKCFFPLLKEAFVKKGSAEDESIYSFAKRRFNSEVADIFFDPLTLGVYAGNCKELSIRSCFPALYDMEKEYGSLIKGMLLKKRKVKKYPFSLFSLKKGIGALTSTLHQKMQNNVQLNTPVLGVEPLNKEILITTAKKQETFTHCFFATDFSNCKKLLPTLSIDIPSINLFVANVGFQQKVLRHDGFGFLVPSQEKKDILGAVFDSNIFPDQSDPLQTRMTFMIKERCKDVKQTIINSLVNTLDISNEPDYLNTCLVKNAIPQYEINHHKKIEGIQDRFTNLFLCGNYLQGASVDQCIHQSKKLVSKFKSFI
ncbi:MAG: protoporphyrinogen oxidase [Chlamydiota bacterium]|jgi:oxygen-dependent protoporphyrinogen oxidase